MAFPPSWRRPAVVITVVLVLVGAALLRLPAWLVGRDTTVDRLEPDQRASAINGVRSTLVQRIVGLAALAGIFVAWQQLQADRQQLNEQLRLTREQLNLTRQGQVAERLTRALEQLGGDTLERQLGGIYGLERIVKESEDGVRLVAAEVLAA